MVRSTSIISRKGKNIFAIIFCVLCCLTIKLEAKIYCCFPFCNEYEILKIHLEELYEVVDYFVIGESCETFRGLPKPYNFQDHQERFKKYLDKIIYVPIGPQKINKNAPENAWIREIWQRNQLEQGIQNAHPDDIIILTDCDEIIHHSAINKLPEILAQNPFAALKLRIYFFFLNYSVYYQDWWGPVATTYKNLKNKGLSFQNLRDMRNNPDIAHDLGGWHFSSMGGFETAYYKATNWAHWNDENNPHVNSINRWKEIGSMTLPDAHIVDIDDTYPECIRKNIDELKEKGLIFVDYKTSIQPTIDIFEKRQ